MKKVYSAMLFFIMLTTGTVCFGQESTVSAIANKFLTTLDAAQRAKAVYEFESGERYNFDFVPKNNRKGVPLNDLNAEQRPLALTILKHYLSSRTYQETQDIMQLENVLRELERRPENDKYRDPGNYYFIFFGTPSEKSAWGWRFEGHHISFSFSTINNKLVSGTPGFLGSNPAIVPSGPGKGKQVLKNEADQGFALIKSLTEAQLPKAILNGRIPQEIISGTGRKVVIEKQEGISYAELTKPQQQLFLQLIGVYLNRYTKKLADNMMHDMEHAGLKNLRLAWVGSYEQGIGKPYYYRIHGPTILIECDNVQNNGNHIHTVVRDLKNDFGGDELLKHYQLHPHTN